ncbi:MAG: hypothetical protein EPN93_07660 [Spirochaetes bacterium]|nr:MAG: hypothetical protein EPN93_07660 [Spirochaetota bacterium]
MTPSSEQALKGLRDLSTLQWYVIPLLAVVFYIYTLEIKNARESKNWDAVFAGLALFGTDFLFETINGWVFALSCYSALWTTPGETALRTTVGWNIEIMFMFSIAGIIWYNTLPFDRSTKVLGIPNRLFWVIAYAIFCVFVECLLNMGGHLVWDWAYYGRSLKGVWPIFFCAYFPLFLSPMLVIGLKDDRRKAIAVGAIYAVAAAMNLLAFWVLGWNY